jgi:hypothetical protein
MPEAQPPVYGTPQLPLSQLEPEYDDELSIEALNAENNFLFSFE